MSRLSRDLLARILATREPKKPKQASLRRAVSTSYYSLFHFLAEEATLLLVGAAHGDLGLRNLANRAFIHGKMKTACTEFVKVNSNSVHKLLQPFWQQPLNVGYNNAIKIIAQTFIDLQADRHDADYNLAIALSRQDALNAITRAENAMNEWRQLKIADREVCRLFSLSLILWPSLSGR